MTNEKDGQPEKATTRTIDSSPREATPGERARGVEFFDQGVTPPPKDADAIPAPEELATYPLHSRFYREVVSRSLAQAQAIAGQISQHKFGPRRVDPIPVLLAVAINTLHLQAFILDELLVAKGEKRAVEIRPNEPGRNGNEPERSGPVLVKG
jgi:hypothetical protein